MTREKPIIKNCENCGKPFKARPRSVRAGNAKYCSMTCYHAARWGHSGKFYNCGKPADTKFCIPKCQKDYWYKHDQEFKESRKQSIWDRKIKLIQSLGGKCSVCGNDDIRVLDINHIDQSTKVTPKKRQYTWARRFRDWEINRDNLEILCANCHRIHTWKQMNYGIINGKSI